MFVCNEGLPWVLRSECLPWLSEVKVCNGCLKFGSPMIVRSVGPPGSDDATTAGACGGAWVNPVVGALPGSATIPWKH